MIGVYGADGFIGRHLTRRLIGRDMPVRAVSRRFGPDFAAEIGGKADVVIADLAEPAAIARSLDGVTTVVQLMSSSSPGFRNDHAVADISENVAPHLQFLQACIAAGVKRYVFVSSGGTVYGPGAPVPTPESALTNPINSYGLTKLFVEKYIQMFGHVDGLDHVILRVANPFGPGQAFRRGQGLVPAIIDRLESGQPVQIFGDGSARRDYIFIDDVIDAIEKAIDLPGHPKLVLNIGSGEARTVIEVVEAIEAATGKVVKREPVSVRATDVGIACLDISEARRVLGWAPSADFRAAIASTVRHARKASEEPNS